MTTETNVLLEPPAEASVPESSTLPSPRVRWAGIVWGLVFSALAVTAIWTVAEASAREAIRSWILAFDPASISAGGIVAASVIAVGVLLLVVGGVALLRRRTPPVKTEQ